LENALADRLCAMAGFRNLLVHGYAEVDPTRLRDISQRSTPDLLAFVTAIRARLV
jgi:uncharacterized protein YutE (UPF0331/DUF86 family)